jgi:hypothetical protein
LVGWDLLSFGLFRRGEGWRVAQHITVPILDIPFISCFFFLFCGWALSVFDVFVFLLMWQAWDGILRSADSAAWHMADPHVPGHGLTT